MPQFCPNQAKRHAQKYNRRFPKGSRLLRAYGKWEIKDLSRDSFYISYRYHKDRDRCALHGEQP